YITSLENISESLRNAIGYDHGLSPSDRWTKRAYNLDVRGHAKGMRVSLVLWAEIGEGSLIGPKLVQETTDKVVAIKERFQAARDRQKSHADNRRKPLEFEVGDHVMLNVSPWKGVVRLAPRYVGPFEILERIGPVAYRLRLPEE
ncbi:hypothetical protein Tco_1151266, partial [Tanacetum coccineum]